MVTLNISEDEAFTLRLVLDSIGGNILHSRRKHTESILKQLIAQDVSYDDAQKRRVLRGGIAFERETV